jgi:hypothetical protein
MHSFFRLTSNVTVILFGILMTLWSLPAVADHHWSPYTMPETIPEGAKTHVIVKGDTLWDLSARYLNNPYLWPQIHDVNRYIEDPHWIYPGDILVIPVVETLEEAGMPPIPPESEEAVTGEEAEKAFAEAAADEEAAPAKPDEDETWAVEPVVDLWRPSETQLYCSPFLPETPFPQELHIIGNEERTETSAEWDIVYLNQGEAQGVSPGDTFSILRNAGMVKQPGSRKNLGLVYWRIGEMKIIAVQENTATGRVMLACQEVIAGDFCIPRQELELTEITLIPELDRYGWAPSGPTGHVIYQQDNLHQAGTGDVVIVTLGMADGLSVGDFLVVYRADPEGRLPIKTLGQAMVLCVEANTATCAIADSYADILNGDGVGLP